MMDIDEAYATKQNKFQMKKSTDSASFRFVRLHR
jgi:hypothetical protein